jgi:ATP-binding cassette subfamily B protein
LEFTPLSRLLLRLWGHFTPRRRRQLVAVLALMVVSAVAELVSLGAVLPFLAILTEPARAFEHPAVARLATVVGATSPDRLALPLTVLFVAATLLAAGTRMLLLDVNLRFAASVGSELGIEVYRRTLHQPYRVHVLRNTSETISGITNKVETVVNGVLQPLLILVSSAVLLVAMAAALIAVDPTIALIAGASFGVSYGAITLAVRRRLRRNSAVIAGEQVQVIKAIQEGLGGIRDVLLDGTQGVYCDSYRAADGPLRRALANNSFMSQSPRLLMEAIGMVLIAALAYGLSREAGGIGAALPTLGALAYGAQRLLPALQATYANWTTIVGSHASLAATVDLLDQPLPAPPGDPNEPPLAVTDAIELRALRFRYSADGPWVLDGLSVRIPAGARIGFVGRTGAGKSTAVDLIMGLLEPTEGEVLVDAEPVRGGRVRPWQRALAHVPQHIFLADTTLAENIAFGVPPASIDRERVRLAARQAQIADFIESGPDGYDARVGERGIRLSGGQRQRIGIARALYKQASVLVFDEATSALDTETEQALMQAIDALERKFTIIIIAHRLTTVRRCDLIVELNRGRVAAEGSFDELLQRSDSFRRLAQAAG